MITNQQADILDHTSNRAAGGFYCGDSPVMQQLIALGLMQSAGRKSFVPDEYFSMTASGRAALREWRAAQPKPAIPQRRKSRAFESWEVFCDACGHTPFSQFWKEIWPSYRFR